MSRRIEIELTSRRSDGSWTWRAAGAREPKGDLPGDLLTFSVEVGDEVTAEAEFHMDGIEIIEVFASKQKRPMPETLEIMGSGREQPLVTTRLVAGRKGSDRSDRRDRNDRRDRQDRRNRSDRRDRGDGKDRSRSKPHREDDRPQPRRLRPQRVHRQAVIDSLPDEQKPIAEKMVRDGIGSVEQTLRDKRKKTRDSNRSDKKSVGDESAVVGKKSAGGESAVVGKKSAEGESAAPETSDDFVAVARKLLPRLRAAEWRDRAEAALAGANEIDLRDLRSVVVAAETGASDDEAKSMAEELRTKLTERVDREHSEWLAEVAATLADGRMVRALRLSSRPPKAGVPLPQDIVTRLTEAANAELAGDTPTKRWITVMGAVAFSPVRWTVQPQGVPEKPDEELLTEVKKLATRIPHIAALFGVEPSPAPKRNRRGPRTQAATAE
ncbi:hypothetical protein [Candidatus Poriferisocius sp.]|uniref:hypothetical protein n=1 Tax=Candidatus Poriferisocius sp. TaxID=3101276 RepID=UPI003B01FDBC